MFRRMRIFLLIILGIALVAMLLLSASLSELDLFPGESASGTTEAESGGLGGVPPGLDEALRTAFRIFSVSLAASSAAASSACRASAPLQAR